jgi:DNA-binding GntR family transcriptional regulator
MPDRATHRSLSRAVYAGIRADILAGRYAPGAKLSPRTIATEYEVSLSVVREALTRLTEQDLVVAAPQLGFSVVELDIDDVRDISRLRILIEGAGLREAIEHADVEYEARLMGSHHRLSRTQYITGHPGETVTEDWARAHADYHRALLSACPSPRLRDLAASLRETAELYRRWSGSFDVHQEPRDVPAEHRGLLEAALDRDPDRAVALLTEHINKTASLLELFMESSGPAVAGNPTSLAEPDAGPAAS